MVGVRTTLTDSLGVRRVLVTADSAFVFQSAQRVDFWRPRVSLFDVQGDQAIAATAAIGQYAIALRTVEFWGTVSLMLPNGKRLSTAHLFCDLRTMRFRSDSAYSLESASGTVNGTGFAADFRMLALGRLEPMTAPR